MTGNAVAIVGMGAEAPGSSDLSDFWANILARRRQFREFPDCRMPLADYWSDGAEVDRTYADRAALLDDFDFDWAKRRIPEATFGATDLAHWLALEVSLKALADAGYTRQTVPTERSAALIGNSLTGDHTRSWAMRLRWPYVARSLRAAASARGVPEQVVAELETTMEDYFKSPFAVPSEDTLAGVLSNTIAGRICNYLDFRGGGYVVDGACSSGLLAIVTAAKSLVSGDIDFALAGGVDVSLDPMELVGFARLGALTRGDMNVYDERAAGFIPGEGCGVVALKRLEDARAAGDRVYATLRGWGISTDGKGGITQPHAETQAVMLRRAYECAGLDPATVDFIEGHGTATPVGDPAELRGIQLAVAPDGDRHHRSVGVTSLKSLIGHTKAASGALALIKTAMAVNRRVLPPLAGCDSPSQVFREDATALYPVLEGQRRDPAESVRAGVQAMGFGGINCHAVLESADAPDEALASTVDERALLVSHQETEVFVFSGASVAELVAGIGEVEDACAGASIGELVDLAATRAGRTRAADPLRAAVVAGRPRELLDRLRQLRESIESAPPRPGEHRCPGREIAVSYGVSHQVGLVFPGQGSQHLGMARTLVERHPWARELVARADDWLVQRGAVPVSTQIWRDPVRARNDDELREWTTALSRTEVTQPAVALAGLLWLKYLRGLNLSPVLVAGHSLGELVALHAAGAYDERTLIELAAAKGAAMANPSGRPGAMASVACGYEQAERLRAAVGPELEIVNVNAPHQIVVAGPEPAVEEALRQSRAQQVNCTRLPVSNAFHSSLMTRARSEFLRDSPLDAEPVTLAVPIYSCVSGKRMDNPCEVRAVVADQIVSPVDWHGLVTTASRECDYFIEVGPGRVLTGLISATNGPDGVPSYPVASRPGQDRDLNLVLAQAFTRGAAIDWDAVYAGRLVREFVHVKDKRFIQNPAEKPFRPSREYEPSTYPSSGAVTHPAEALREYLDRRGDFLVDVIRADLGSGGGTERRVPAAAPAVAAPPGRIPEAPAPVETSSPPVAASGVIDRLIAVLAERTGFEVGSIDPQLRLLDDLNLDSIKAAEVIGVVADEFAIETVDPAEFANSTVAEIAAALRAAVPEAGHAAPGPDATGVAGVLFDVIVEMTGFGFDTLTTDLKLVDDLNLDSIKAAEAISRVWARLGLTEPFDPGEVAGGTLDDIVRTATALLAGRPQGTAAVDAEPEGDADSSWVRGFLVEPVAEPLADVEADPFDGASVLLLAEEADREVATAVADALVARGAEVRAADFDNAEFGAAQHVFVVLPPPGSVEESAEAIAGTVRRLHVAVPPVRSDVGSLTYIQFGGTLSLGNEPGAAISSSADAFAASVHHERPDLRVRVLDFDRAFPVGDLAGRVLDELRTATPFVSAGYDEAGVRRVSRARLVDGPDLTGREHRLERGDVVLVTGGAKGIMAECALALADTYGVRLALVGSSPRTGSAEVEATLRRCAERGLTAHYFSCDVTDPEAVRELLPTVARECGPVSAIVHGAGLNRPRRVEATDPDFGYTEIAPKITGAINLMHAAEELGLTFFIGVSSIIGVTGMPGNSWYALGNQMLDGIVREVAERGTTCAMVSISYSVWGETGMGARMGSVDQLAKKGIGAIPTAEGVRHFLRLVDSSPGASRVVVSGRLGGLDTWYRERRDVPGSCWYLDRLVRSEPGVDVVAEFSLDADRDGYVGDHVWKGTPLLPTVFGLEAMAQAVHCVSGRELDRVRVENVVLRRPITVAPGTSTRVRVEATVCERTANSTGLRVRAAVRTARSRSPEPEFTAEFVLFDTEPAPRRELPTVDTTLDLDPAKHLYGGLLFQGPRYQRLRTVHSLDSQHCRFTAELVDPTGSYLLGDPFFLDALLQSGQLVVPQALCLPVAIESIDLYPERFASGTVDSLTDDKVENEDHITARVTATVEGRVVAELVGYRSKIVQRRPDNPTAEDLAGPRDRDKQLLDRTLAGHAEALDIEVPEVTLWHEPGMHGVSRDERHEREQPIFAEAVAMLNRRRGGTT